MNLPFAISARTAKLIGLENFANAEGAVVELVKNAYDADADKCFIIVDKKANAKESLIYIIDTGSGMNKETIVNHWMTIGTDDKLINSKSKKKNRVKSGAKGIGRFALNRLGTFSRMFTFCEDSHCNGLDWTVDWTKFEDASVLSEVKAELNEIDTSKLIKNLDNLRLFEVPILEDIISADFHGTILCVSNLNDNWGLDSLESLRKNLEMLIPVHIADSFKIYLYNLNNLEWGGEIEPLEYDDFDYKILSNFDGKDSINVKLVRNELNVSLLESSFANVFKRKAMQASPYRIEDFKNNEISLNININTIVDTELLSKVGAFDFTFFFLKNSLKDDRDEYGKKKYPYNDFEASLRQKWLDRFGGVRLYRDGFRVRPYGENGDDWLGLGKRQAKSPGGAGQRLGGYRIRPNQIAGSVHISRLENKALEDKSSREGIQENEVFTVFKNIILQIISSFENDRNVIMYNLSELYKGDHPISTQATEIAKVAYKKDYSWDDTTKEQKDFRILAEGYQSLERELKEKDAELSMLRGLASLGVSASTFSHELGSLMLRLDSRSTSFKNILMKYISEDKIQGIKYENPFWLLDEMRNEDKKIHDWISYSLTTIRRNKRDWKLIDLNQYFDSFKKLWFGILNNKNIEIDVYPKYEDVNKQMHIEGFEIDLDSIFNNYITNSINSLLNSSVHDKKIIITLKEDHGFAIIDVEDNGGGLSKEYVDSPDKIFHAFETSKVDNKNNKIGTGMGLYIAKSVISKYEEGDIRIIPIKEGFGIRTVFRIKRNG